MSKVIKKLFFAWQIDKERKFLEEMALEGYILSKVRLGKYEFTECDPKKVTYQFDFQVMRKKDEEEYLSFFKDWTLAGRFGSWYYFYKEHSDNDDNLSIFNDKTSNKGMYKRLLGFLLLAGFPLYYQLLIFFPNMQQSNFNYPSFYFFFKPVVIVVSALHLYAMIKILLVYVKLSKAISE